MAIDIRELRIGNHVQLDGERVAIDEISISGQVGCITQDNDWLGVDANDRLDPIPITEDLLKELGFEKDDDNILNVPVFSKDIDGFFIEVKEFNGYDEWRVHIDDCDRDSVGVLDLYYLHELENLVFMTTKKELLCLTT